jgi:hypothetical protein
MANEVQFVVKAMRAFYDDSNELSCIRCYNTPRGGNKATITGRGNSKSLKVTTQAVDENAAKLSAYFFPEDDDFQSVYDFGVEMGWLAAEEDEE